jgi:integrase
MHWLEDAQDLAVSTTEDLLATAKQLLQDWLGAETACVRRLRRLRVDDVEDSFVRHGRTAHGKAAKRALQCGMRRLLQFCAEQGWVSPELAAAVPRIQTYRLSTVPRGVSEADLSRLVAALSPTGPSAARNRAILLVLATYGVRRGQVAALRLSDLDWRRRRITFPAHKGGRTVRHVLSPAVAEALACYLRQRPPECEVEQVFLRACRPHVGISPGAITIMIRQLFVRAGVESRPRGPHSLRHAFARRLLAARQPFKVIADLLGHRSLRSTAIYAKVDRPFLAEAPLEWPEVLR